MNKNVVAKDKSESTDLTFIVNDPGKTLKDRFIQLIKKCRFFDVLVAYFYVSGFYLLYKALKNTKKIRILIGIGTSRETYELIKTAPQNELIRAASQKFSHAQVKDSTRDAIKNEIENLEDNKDLEEGIRKFIECINNGKLEIKAYPSQKLHAKLYILTFKKGYPDVGRVITGSSNFTQSGLVDNLEFNVELKNRFDYEFAKKKFDELWKEAVDLTKEFVQTIEQNTWLKDDITPYELYLKFLYEYFREELSSSGKLQNEYLPQNFIRFKYQEQAVLNAKKILEEYGGCFISDVV
ncbi:MAG: phospholipase D-like domain-containing protein, partial [Leptospiraceae bacterium]|nr:phospholipase D-like domain-containing protein [Leptospiraceae bacterium]